MAKTFCFRCAGNKTEPTTQVEAIGFIRVKHTNRLCPLCPACMKAYETAVAALSEEAKKLLPGGGEGIHIALEDGAAEYAAQPSRAEYDKTHKPDTEQTSAE